MSKLSRQIESTLKHAFENLLSDTFSKNNLTENDIDWIVRLCKELKERINNLTPSRIDLHNELDKSFDIDLLKQMLLNDAFDDNDLISLTHTIEHKLLSLCAPAQDENIKMFFNSIRNETKNSIKDVLVGSNQILDDIYELNRQYKLNMKKNETHS